MEFDIQKVAEYVRRADDMELLDRITVYREGMEPAAVDLIENELSRRGLTDEDIRFHQEWRSQSVLFHTDGTALTCSFCDRPAVSRGWDWHRLWGLVPVFPRLFRYCQTHLDNPRERGYRAGYFAR